MAGLKAYTVTVFVLVFGLAAVYLFIILSALGR